MLNRTLSRTILTFGIALTPLAQAQAPQTSAETVSSGPELQEVTVTAQRRSESLQHAALAISAVSSEELTSSGATRVQELTSLVPALQVSTAAGPYPLFYVRGVGNFNGNPLSDAALALNLDGVYIARPSGSSGLFYDLERLEVLKGPQGTLYGRNATAGAINVITRKPTSDFNADANMDFGNYSLRKFDAAVNIPLSSMLG
jgi:iron complex outermembrane receptor protein